MLILDTFICNDHFPKPIVLLLVPVSTIQSHRHELLPHHQGQRLGLHWEDSAPSPQQRRGAHLEIEVVEGRDKVLVFFNGTPGPWLPSICYLLTDTIPAETRIIKKTG